MQSHVLTFWLDIKIGFVVIIIYCHMYFFLLISHLLNYIRFNWLKSKSWILSLCFQSHALTIWSFVKILFLVTCIKLFVTHNFFYVFSFSFLLYVLTFFFYIFSFRRVYYIFGCVWIFFSFNFQLHVSTFQPHIKTIYKCKFTYYTLHLVFNHTLFVICNQENKIPAANGTRH